MNSTSPARAPESTHVHASPSSTAAASVPILRFEAPIRTQSINASQRQHPQISARQRRYQKEAMLAELLAKGSRVRRELVAALDGYVEGEPPRLVVLMTRVSDKRLDDDNLAGAFKPPRDAIAHWLGVDDGSHAVRWLRDQERQLLGFTKVFDRRGHAKLVRTMLLRVEISIASSSS